MILIPTKLISRTIPLISKQNIPSKISSNLQNISNIQRYYSSDAAFLPITTPFSDNNIKPSENDLSENDSSVNLNNPNNSFSGSLFFNPKNKIRKLISNEDKNLNNNKKKKKNGFTKHTILTNELIDAITEQLVKPYELEYNDFSLEFFENISPLDLFQYMSTINETENIVHSEILSKIYTIENFKLILIKLISYHSFVRKSSKLNFKIEKQFGLAYSKLASELFKTIEISINYFLHYNPKALTFSQYKYLIKFFGENYKIDTVNYYFENISYDLDINLWNAKFKYLCDGQPELWSYKRTRHIAFDTSVNPIWLEKRRSHGYKPFIDLFHSFQSHNITPNQETLSLIILCIARNSNLSTLQDYIQKNLGINVDQQQYSDDIITSSYPIQPNYDILKSIITAFAYHNEFLKGLMTVMMIEKKFDKIDLSNPKALFLWKTLLQWAELTTSKRISKKNYSLKITKAEKLEEKSKRKELLNHLWLYYLRTHSNVIDLDMINLRFNILRRSNDVLNVINDLPILHMNYIKDKSIFKGIFAKHLTYIVKISIKTNHELQTLELLNRFNDNKDLIITLFIQKLQDSIDKKKVSDSKLKEGLVERQIRLQEDDDEEFGEW
ncbi:uncharacterized protein ASCRUDRAFT_74059 [Ascoidea rubescens DSM 1968]|uniref:ATPase expression protein 2, mitochondrial n=1 Tax=Ascoidea rubescens DSM 1968 TaxID=1344418 RepID=A0A1D2VS92_9ASCO|nr:hypothetical protein ASCRUDRAFT_74059 [Ascoidea rubescens DSM 1968]ODV64435.1 hypothetical protein ASCRUDRAFT_74059 [Ascoidea rubescens DSM 1968]